MKTINDIIIISSSGIIAGMISELLSYYLSPLEKYNTNNNNIKKIIKISLNLPRPLFSSIIIATIPTSIGFLAYEYGKIEVDNNTNNR